MGERPTEEEINRWHRWFAIECNNRSWDLAEQETRTPEENREMKSIAFAAAYHWSKVGTPVNDARADLTLAHVLSVLQDGSQARLYAQRALTYFQANPAEDWDLAFAWMELAFAANVAGQADVYARAYQRAQELGNAIKGEEDRKIFLDEFARIPKPVI